MRQGALSSSVLRPGFARPVTPDLSAGFADVDASKTGAVVVSDASNNDVYAYSTKGKLVATITGFNEPQGLATDPTGNVYIANTGGSNILVYKSDYKTLIATLADKNQYPAGVGYDATTGTVGVTNIVTTGGGAGSVSFFDKGKKTPSCTIANATFARVYFGAFDDAGDFYVDGQDSSGNTLVGVVIGGCKAKTITQLTVKNAIAFPGGVEVSPTDQLLIDDQNGPSVYTYKPVLKGSLGSPTATTALTGSSDPVTFSLTKTAKDLFTADAGLAASLEFALPKGGKAVETITSAGQPIGVAVTPAEQP